MPSPRRFRMAYDEPDSYEEYDGEEEEDDEDEDEEDEDEEEETWQVRRA